MSTDPPTVAEMATTGFKLTVWCKSCRHQEDMRFGDLMAARKGRVRVIDLRFRCSNCGSRLTDHVVRGSHDRPTRSGAGKRSQSDRAPE
jgi:hypothetical protein